MDPPRAGADIFKLHLKTKRVVRLTNQRFSPNTGAANWSTDYRTPEAGKSHFEYGVFNTGPCPLPGGRVAFTSNRDGFKPAKGYPAILRDVDLASLVTNLDCRRLAGMMLIPVLHPGVSAALAIKPESTNS